VQARFALVGGNDAGNPASASDEWLKERLQDGVVEWWGHRADMHAVFAEAHIVCLPSYREGLPKALLEAAASGRPIVTTDVPGCRETIVHGEGGYLVPARDAESLATSLRMLLEHPEARLEMGRRNRTLAEREYGVQKIVQETLLIYGNLA
jgi:glycosyltransferase involved in cell wall biosynthesis